VTKPLPTLCKMSGAVMDRPCCLNANSALRHTNKVLNRVGVAREGALEVDWRSGRTSRGSPESRRTQRAVVGCP
jgi:hypothetical protein